jgi:TolB-like protein
VNAPSGDAVAVRFAEALRRDFIDGVSAAGTDVIVLNLPQSTDSDAGFDGRSAARSLGARYVVQGDVRSGDGAKVLNIRLVDALSGVLTWSGQYALDDTSDYAKTATTNRFIVGKLIRAVWTAETRRVLSLPTERLEPTELVLRGWAVEEKAPTLENALQARKMFATALAKDPNNVAALKATVSILD